MKIKTVWSSDQLCPLLRRGLKLTIRFSNMVVTGDPDKSALGEQWGQNPCRVRSEEINDNDHGKLFETFLYKAEQKNGEIMRGESGAV